MQGQGSTSNKSLRADISKIFSDFVSSGIQYLVPVNKDYQLTRVVDAIMELKESSGVDKYLYLDPKFPSNSAPRKTTPFQEAIVFVVGGGNYLEFHNLQEYSKRTTTQQVVTSKKIIYGSTEIVNGNDFVMQLAKLGK